MITRTRAVLVALAALTLTACGNVHPGTAAVVDGQSITMKELDAAARNYCLLSLPQAQAQGQDVLDNGDLRRQALTDMVSRLVAKELADEQGVAARPEMYTLTASQRRTLAEAFPDHDLEELVQVIEENQELFELAAQLGAREAGETLTEENQPDMLDAGQALITEAFTTHKVRFDPRFGLDRSGKPKATTGTLAAVQVDLEKPTAGELPPEQRCS